MRKTGKKMIGVMAAVLTVMFGILPAVYADAPQPEPISAEVQYAAAAESMLYIRCFYSSGGLKTTGSGFVVSSDGLALTAAHVVDKAARVTAVDPAGKELECTVTSVDTEGDVAVLRLPGGSYKALQIADSAAAGGAILRAMGYPIKDALLITEGLLSSPSGTINEKQRMLVSCNIVNGMSGGPVFDRFGKVVGLCSGSVRTMPGIHLSALWSSIKNAADTKMNNK